ncbi:MAG: CarD family transcriptional regulator [Alphaproteobacteria bacterium]|jgi:CarD family transcriptional regulator|nr:CarD family transcriptional regulator [Alphaproteobacteria bacterium]
MKTKPKSKTAAKATAKAKTKSAPKKVSKPVAKATSPKAKTLAKSAPKTVAKTSSKPAAKPVAKAATKPAAKPAAPVKPAVAAKPAAPAKPAPVAARPAAPAPAPTPVQAGRPMMTGPVVATPAPKKLSFKAGELVVYPAHGVGKIVMIEEQEIAGAKLELYIVDFEKEKLRLKVPTGRAEQKGMRRLSDKGQIEVALKVLKGRARIKRTMWSRRAQEYDAKINSGDLIAVSEVVRDLYRSERQPEQSYSERQLFEQALERMAREIAAVKKIDDDQAIKELEEYLAKNAKRPAGTEKAEDDVQADEAA